MNENLTKLNTGLEKLLFSTACFSEHDKDCVNLIANQVVSWYGDSKRKFEQDGQGNPVFSFEHPLRVSNLILDHYFNGNDYFFSECFNSNCIEHLYMGLLHDVVEDGKASFEDLRNFLVDEKLAIDSLADHVVVGVRRLSRDFKARTPRYAQLMTHYLSELKKDKSSANVKCFDILDNSSSISVSERVEDLKQFDKFRGVYSDFVKEVMPMLHTELMRNVYLNMNTTQFSHIAMTVSKDF